jgi:glutaredoxin 3
MAMLTATTSTATTTARRAAAPARAPRRAAATAAATRTLVAAVAPALAPRAIATAAPTRPLAAAAPLSRRTGRLSSSPDVRARASWFDEGKSKFFEMLAGSYDAAQVNALIDSKINGNAAVVFSWTTCPYCVKAKEELTAMGAKFEAVEINTLPEGKAIKAELAKRTGRTSVPQVFVKGEFLGGCNDGPKPGYGIVPLKSSGKLAEILKAAGAL